MTNNPTIDGVSRELMRKQFEEKNEHRKWFVADGRSDDTAPEGFVYEDFTTDMCWTCYFEASAALQSTIAQLQARIVELESGRGEMVEAMLLSDCEEFQHEIYGAGYFGTDVIELFTAPPAPVAVVLPDRGGISNRPNYNEGWNACLDATATLNGAKS